ncbi:conserved hypothetical protein, partial [Trichinella spiralis]|uniref:hypothetical protein n=1 Tax=Trichinella spiralis TaxID=6334 RepID=UPI0001EFED95
TCCGYQYDQVRDLPGVARIFTYRRERSEHREKVGVLWIPESLSPDNPVPGNASLKKKRKLFSKLTTVIFRVRLRYRAIELNANPTERLKRYSLSPLLGSGISTGFPFENIRQLHTTTTGDDTIASTTTHTQIIIQSYNSCRKFEQAFADRLTHLQLLFTWNLAPLQPSRFSLEYLLLPPRSAPTAAPSELTLKTLQSNTVATFLPVSTFITPFPKKKCVIETVRYGPGAQTLSIFRASRFGR